MSTFVPGEKLKGTSKTSRKIIVIGLDGADWRLIQPLIDAGELPNMARLVDDGVSGPLRSTIRPESSVAWSTFATGVSPGEHGIFSFLRPERGSYRFKLANASNIGVRPFWDVIGNTGYRVGLVNVPFTYPPKPLNGFLVGGMLTPGSNVSFTYPPELQARILTTFPDYQFDAADATEDKKALSESVNAYTRQQIALALMLMREEAWDLFTVVFTGPDRLQHYFWSDMDPKHPHHDPRSSQLYGRVIQDQYVALDQAIGQLLDAAGGDALVIVMSDHGFNGCANCFYVNNWLEENGYLVTRRGQSWQSFAADELERLKQITLLRRLKRLVWPGGAGPTELRASQFTKLISWSETRAYFAADGGIRINLEGREPQGIVKPGRPFIELKREITSKLENLRDTRRGLNPLAQVYDGEALYHGRFANLAPDLILEPQREHTLAANNYILNGSPDRRAGIFGSSSPYSGNHALDGILIISGQGIERPARIDNARLLDLPPTILAAMGVAIPAHVEGKVITSESLSDILSENVQASAEPPLSRDNQAGEDFSPDEESIVESRLRNLGYLD